MTWLLISLLVGLIVGAIAKRLIPGASARSSGFNMLLGVAGALIGGFAGAAIGLYGVTTLPLALLGALLAIFGISAAGRTKTHRGAVLKPNAFASTAAPQPAEEIAARTVALPTLPQPFRTETHASAADRSDSTSSARQHDITLKSVTTSDRPHIFLSYATPDRAVARALATALSQQGFNVWWDRTIPPGKSFDEVIEQALDSARCVVVLWTKSSASSNWVRAEAAEGLRRQILVPVVMEEVRIPLEFRRIQAANLADWHQSADHPGFRSLLSSLVNVVGPS